MPRIRDVVEEDFYGRWCAGWCVVLGYKTFLFWVGLLVWVGPSWRSELSTTPRQSTNNRQSFILSRPMPNRCRHIAGRSWPYSGLARCLFWGRDRGRSYTAIRQQRQPVPRRYPSFRSAFEGLAPLCLSQSCRLENRIGCPPVLALNLSLLRHLGLRTRRVARIGVARERELRHQPYRRVDKVSEGAIVGPGG